MNINVTFSPGGNRETSRQALTSSEALFRRPSHDAHSTYFSCCAERTIPKFFVDSEKKVAVNFWPVPHTSRKSVSSSS
jgi:hypothetical protein